MPSKDPTRRLEDILANILCIEEYKARVANQAEFEEDHLVYDAVERCLERISEAASKLGEQAELLCPGIPWSRVRGLGNILRHEYDRVESSRLWYTMEDDLPPLKIAVSEALRKLFAEERQQ